MVVLLWLGAAVFVALTAIGPKRLYWATQAPFQRNAGDAIADNPTTASEDDLVVPVIKGQGSVRVGVPHDSAQGEQDELTNSSGHNPVCLTVALDQPPGTLVADRTVTYHVTAGRCPTG